MTRHIGAETLARFRQGDLSPRRNARIRAHLGGCARCSDLNEDLAGVTTLLAGAQPPPIPEHLAARIQTALATEAARRGALTAGAAENPARGPRAQAERPRGETTRAEPGGGRAAGGARPRGGGRSPAAGPARQPATVGSLPLSTLEGCVNRIAAGELVLLVDVARYQGAPATVIVTEVSAASPEQVWVVGTGCSGSRSDVLAQVTVAPAG